MNTKVDYAQQTEDWLRKKMPWMPKVSKKWQIVFCFISVIAFVLSII
jgi:hypothetical protein